MGRFSVVSQARGCYRTWLTVNSYVCWGFAIDHPEHLPRESGEAFRQNIFDPRRTALLLLHRECSPAHRTVLVWLDILPLYTLDCAYGGCWLCYYGHLLDIPCGLQLLGGYVSSICKLSFSGAVILPEYAWRYIPSHSHRNVHTDDLCWSCEFSWRHRRNSYSRPVGTGILRAKDPST